MLKTPALDNEDSEFGLKISAGVVPLDTFDASAMCLL